MMKNPPYVRMSPRLGCWKMHSNVISVYYLMKLNGRKAEQHFPKPVVIRALKSSGI